VLGITTLHTRLAKPTKRKCVRARKKNENITKTTTKSSQSTNQFHRLDSWKYNNHKNTVYIAVGWMAGCLVAVVMVVQLHAIPLYL
jgi:hypothetical protein